MGLQLHLYAIGAPAHDATADAVVRDEIRPRLLASGSVEAVYAGRHGDSGKRVIASIRDDAEPADPDLDENVLASLAERDGLPDVDLTVAPVAVIVRPDGPAPLEPRVIRLFHGRVRSGELAAYIEEVRAGATADARDGGLVALYLGAIDERRFVTVSVWTDWDAVSRATGGDVRRPASTRNPDRLEEWSVDHYEALPA